MAMLHYCCRLVGGNKAGAAFNAAQQVKTKRHAAGGKQFGDGPKNKAWLGVTVAKAAAGQHIIHRR